MTRRQESTRRRLLALPAVGEWFLRFKGRQVLSEGLRHDFYRPERMPSSLPAVYRAFMDEGFFRAIHRSVRRGMLGPHEEAFLALGRAVVPVLALWGEHDATVPPRQAVALQMLVPHARVERIPEAGHLPHIEQPEKAHPLLTRFLAI